VWLNNFIIHLIGILRAVLFRLENFKHLSILLGLCTTDHPFQEIIDAGFGFKDLKVKVSDGVVVLNSRWFNRGSLYKLLLLFLRKILLIRRLVFERKNLLVTKLVSEFTAGLVLTGWEVNFINCFFKNKIFQQLCFLAENFIIKLLLKGLTVFVLKRGCL
tara:strand:- start:1074 stop:1553 length:480 start_codon:yes stop_codon:yes gene_type:complete